LQLVLASHYRCWPVCDDRGVVGVMNKRSLERAANEHGMAKQLFDLVDAQSFPHLHADQSLQMALERMGGARLDLLPVVSRADVHKLEGVVLLRDVLDSYGIGAENGD
jgi:CBS domain-containing protein